MKIKYLLCCAAVLLSGCGKDYSRVIRLTEDSLQGYYVIETIQWQGNPIDLEGDGTANTDLMKEFEGLPNTKDMSFFKTVVDPRFYERDGYCSSCFDVPLQGLTYSYSYAKDHPDQPYAERYLLGADFNVMVKFTIEESSGQVNWLHYDSTGRKSDGMKRTDYTDLYELGNGDVIDYGEGRMTLRIDCSYYDYSTKSKVHGPEIITFSRISSVVL